MAADDEPTRQPSAGRASARSRRRAPDPEPAEGGATALAEPSSHNGVPTEQSLDQLLGALHAVRDGDFSVRLPARRGGLMGELALAYNEVAETNERLVRELQRVSRVIGREGRMSERAGLLEPRGSWATGDRLGQRADRRPRPPDDRGRARHPGRRPRRPLPDDGAGDRGPAGQGRVPAHRHHRERDGRPALGLLGRGHPGGARGRHRGPARRPGPGHGRLRHVEGPHRHGQLDGRQPDQPGAQHRAGDDGRGERRPVPEDHRRRPRRDRSS